MSRMLMGTLCILAAPYAAAQDKGKEPMNPGPSPRFVTVARVDPAKGMLVLRSTVAIPEFVLVEREIEKNGQKLKVVERRTMMRHAVQETEHALKGMTAMEASGKILMGWNDVKAGAIVLLAADGSGVAPAMRALLAPRTIILVPTQTGDAPLPPVPLPPVPPPQKVKP